MRCTLVATALLILLTSTSPAQPPLERKRPQVWFTQGDHRGAGRDLRFVSMASIQIHNGNTPNNDPQIAATNMANLIQSRITGGTLTPSTVAIFLHGWGHDGPQSEPPQPPPAPQYTPWHQPLRFFCAGMPSPTCRRGRTKVPAM